MRRFARQGLCCTAWQEGQAKAPAAAPSRIALLRSRPYIEDLQRELRDLKQMVDVLGPAALGTQRILTHWAAQTGGLRVSEDEPLAEGRLVAEEEWQGQLAERGLFSPGALVGKAEG